MEVFLSVDIPPFVMYCVNGKPRSSLFIESTDSMIYSVYCVSDFGREHAGDRVVQDPDDSSAFPIVEVKESGLIQWIHWILSAGIVSDPFNGRDVDVLCYTSKPSSAS